MIDAVTRTELSAAALGAPSQSAEGLRGCLGTMRQEPSCLTIAEEKPNISLNAEQTLPQTNLTDLTSAPIRKEPNKPKVGKRFAERKHLVPNCCLTRSSKRQSNQECTVKILINDYDCSKSFFYHRAVGWFLAKFLADASCRLPDWLQTITDRQTISLQVDNYINVLIHLILQMLQRWIFHICVLLLQYKQCGIVSSFYRPSLEMISMQLCCLCIPETAETG